MFLYDRCHTSRATVPRKSGALRLAWAFDLRSQRRTASETQVVQDSQGSYFFGAHNGCIYSATEDGELRWMYATTHKIYPSPILIDTALFVLTCTGFLIALNSKTGLERWITRVADRPRPKRWLSDASLIASFAGYDYDPRQRLALRAWGSPNLSPDCQTIYAVARGTGLAAIDAASGVILWRGELGGPPHHLSGPVVATDGRIFASSQRGTIACFSSTGAVAWRIEHRQRKLNTWGGLSMDETQGLLFLTSSWKNTRGIVEAFDIDSRERLWATQIPGALRGCAAVADERTLFLASGNGKIYRLNARTGHVEAERSIAKDPDMITLWTTPVVSGTEILLSTVFDVRSGGLLVLDWDLHVRDRFDCGKALAPPFVDRRGRLVFGAWDHRLYCLET